MSAHSSNPRWFRDTDEEAGRWFARLLDPDCGEAERASFERWRAASPAHAAAFAGFEALWADGAEVANQPAIAAAARVALHEATRAPRPRHWMPALAAAASILLVVSGWIGWRTWQNDATAPGVRYATATGQQRNVQLADGSSLLLDTDSEVVVRLGRNQRDVELLRGRVQFDVRHDPARPFAVHAEGGIVTDVGTIFQMRLDASAVDVTLLHGAVAVTTRAHGQARSTSLKAGERLRYGRDGTIGPAQPVDELAAEGWTHGKLFVHDWSLPQLLAAMNRYSDTKLVIADPTLDNLRISGAFKAGDQQTLLQILHEGWSIQAQQAAPDRIVLSRRASASTRPAQSSRR